MSELSKRIIESNNLKEKIDFFFETLIVDMKFNDKEWLLTSKNGDKFKSKYLICSTNLLLHKRSLKILKVNQIPLRKAIPINNDKKIGFGEVTPLQEEDLKKCAKQLNMIPEYVGVFNLSEQINIFHPCIQSAINSALAEINGEIIFKENITSMKLIKQPYF